MRSILIFLFFALAVAAVQAGFKDLVCGNTPEGINCEADCIHNHGALGGKCGDMSKGDYNCYCEGYSPTGDLEKGLLCKEQDDDYKNVCTIDCLCTHAALGGYCDPSRKACICVGSGSNVQNVNCPASDAVEVGRLVYNYLGSSKAMGAHAMEYIVEMLKNQTVKN